MLELVIGKQCPLLSVIGSVECIAMRSKVTMKLISHKNHAHVNSSQRTSLCHDSVYLLISLFKKRFGQLHWPSSGLK